SGISSPKAKRRDRRPKIASVRGKVASSWSAPNSAGVGRESATPCHLLGKKTRASPGVGGHGLGAGAERGGPGQARPLGAGLSGWCGVFSVTVPRGVGLRRHAYVLPLPSIPG